MAGRGHDERDLGILAHPAYKLGAASVFLAKMLTSGGLIYVTQTFQNRRSRIAEFVKPLLRRFTSVDFGKVTYHTEVLEIVAKAGLTIVEDGAIPSTPMGSLGYRLYGEDDRIRLLWVLRVPGATAAELGMPTESQRDNALAGRGTPWMMNEGTSGAHLMIPINSTELSNR